MTMPHVQLIYVSTAVNGLKIDEVKKIVHISQAHNKSVNITGCLCANSSYFIYVEVALTIFLS